MSDEERPAKSFPPNKALQIFEPVIGNWRTEGSHGLIPDTPLHGHTMFSWHESGAFVMVQSTIDEDVGIPAGGAIIGSDDALGLFAMLYYDERGISRNYSVSMQDNVLKWWRDAPGMFQRYSLTISEDGRTMVGKGELSEDGSNWQKDLDLTYKKV